MGVLRLMLALSVVIQHLDGAFGGHSGILPGTIAVEIFFAISGFYMSLILSGKERNCWITRAFQSPGNHFIARRICGMRDSRSN